MRHLALLFLILAAGGCKKAASVAEPIATAHDAEKAYDLYVASIRNPQKLLEAVGQIEASYPVKPANYKDVSKVSAALIGENDEHLSVTPEPAHADPARSYLISFNKLTEQQCQALLKPAIVAAFAAIRVNSSPAQSSRGTPISDLCTAGTNSIAFVAK